MFYKSRSLHTFCVDCLLTEKSLFQVHLIPLSQAHLFQAQFHILRHIARLHPAIHIVGFDPHTTCNIISWISRTHILSSTLYIATCACFHTCQTCSFHRVSINTSHHQQNLSVMRTVVCTSAGKNNKGADMSAFSAVSSGTCCGALQTWLPWSTSDGRGSATRSCFARTSDS